MRVILKFSLNFFVLSISFESTVNGLAVYVLCYMIGETDFNFNFIKNEAVHSYNTRRSNDLRLSLPRTNWGKQTFIYQAAKDWNSLPNVLKETHLLSIFKSKLKTFSKDFD